MTRAKEYVQYIARGISPSYDNDGVIVLNQKCIRNQTISFSESRFTNIAKKKIADEKYVQNYDVLINSTGVGTLGRVAQIKNIEGPTTVDSHVTIVRPNLKKIDGDFFGYCFKAQQSLIETLGVGATGQTELSRVSILENVEIPEYSLKQQKNIANIMSHYDDLIENNNKRIKILEEMAQKIYKEWFVDFKFPGYETATFKQTELGKIPSDWGVIKANEIADIYIGRTPSRKDFDCFTKNKKDKKWISIKDIGLSNEFIFDTSEYLTDDAIKKYNVPLIPKDTVILSFKLTVGKVAITTEEMTSNEAIAQFQIKNKEEISENYLYLYLKNFEYNNLGNTSSIGNAINSTIVKNMPIIAPKEDIIKEFNKNIISIFSQIKNLTLKIQALKETRDLLLPRLISGEIDVENLEIV